jgi:hypothetical protein
MTTMVRTVQRRYVLDDRDVHEAILAYLKAKDIVTPEYVGNTPTCQWDWGEDTITVSWTDELKD